MLAKRDPAIFAVIPALILEFDHGKFERGTSKDPQCILKRDAMDFEIAEILPLIPFEGHFLVCTIICIKASVRVHGYTRILAARRAMGSRPQSQAPQPVGGRVGRFVGMSRDESRLGKLRVCATLSGWDGLQFQNMVSPMRPSLWCKRKGGIVVELH